MSKKMFRVIAVVLCVAVCVMSVACSRRPRGSIVIDDDNRITITLDRETLNLKAGESDRLIATATPVGVNVKWKSLDSGIAAVSDGVVTGISAGTTTVIAYVESGINGVARLFEASCTVNVSSVPPVTTDKTEISFWYWGSISESGVFEELAMQYEKDHPDIKINKTHYDASEYMTRLNAQRVKPDVFFLPDIEFAQWAHTGMLLPLDGYATRAELDEIWDSAIDDYRYDAATKTLGSGALYGFPKDLGPTCLAYNKTLLDSQIEANRLTTKYGMTKAQIYDEYLDPKKPMTWESFTTFLVDLTADQDKSDPNRIYGIPYFELESALYSNNADFITSDAKTQKIDNRFIEAVIFNIQLDTKYHVMPDAYHSGSESSYSRFYRNNTIFTWMGPWDNAEFWQHTELDYDVIPVPYNGAHDDTKSVTYVGSMCYSVSAASKEKQAAADFAKWLGLGSSAQTTAMELGQQIPNIKRMASDFCAMEAPPANKSLFIDMVDDTNVIGLYEFGEKDMITSRRRTAYRTYTNVWKDNLLTYMINSGMWLESSENYLTARLVEYREDLQRDLDLSNTLWGRN